MTISPLGSAAQPPVTSGASLRQPPTQKMSNLFDRIDNAGSGDVSRAQFDQAFKTMNPPKPFKDQGADAIWKQLDPGGSGSVSRQDFVDKMKGLMVSLRAQPGHTVSAGLSGLNGLGA